MRDEIFKTALMTMVLAGTSLASGHNPIPVCVERPALDVVFPAMHRAETIFDEAGIATRWMTSSHCSASVSAIRITFDAEIHPAAFRPNAMAYAYPYEGSHIVIMLDRVKAFAASSAIGHWNDVLAYVMAHEVGHLLEGVDRHSKTGIMKAAFTVDETFDMLKHRLRFAAEDLELMDQGIERRWTVLEASAVADTSALR